MPSNHYPRRMMTRRETFLESVNPERSATDSLLVAHGYGGLDEARAQERARETYLRAETSPFRAQRGSR